MDNPGSISIAEWFHQETKYDRRTINLIPMPDYEQQPPPWKQWHSRHPIDLVPYLPFTDFPLGPAEDQEPLDPKSLSDEVGAISRLLFFSCGATGFQQTPSGTQIFRAAPSAGALYPTEVTLALRGIDGLKEGLYAYSVPHHQLIPLFEGIELDEVSAACWNHPSFESSKICVLLSGLWQRSRWRYHHRAYRRILLDTGHIIGNLVHAAGDEGYQATPLTRFVDQRLQRLLFLDEEEEGVLSVIPLQPWSASRSVGTGDSARQGVRVSALSEISKPPEEDAILALHQSGHLLDDASIYEVSDLEREGLSPRSSELADGEAEVLGETMIDLGGEFSSLALRRRSTRQFTGAPMDRGDLERILDFTHRFIRPGPIQFVGAPESLKIHCVTSRVRGIEPALWQYDEGNHVLFDAKYGDHRRKVQELCLGQELAGDAAAVVIYSASLKDTLAIKGDRAYRDVHMDAGFLGHQINLACMHLNLGVSGIAGFFDDAFLEFLGLPEDHIVTYITLVGEPMPGL